MANAIYPLYKRARASWSDAGLAAAIDLQTDTIKACLVDTGVYAYSDAHQFFSSLAGAVYGNSGNTTRADMPTLAAKTTTLVGAIYVFDAADLSDALANAFQTVPAPPAVPTIEAIVIFKDDGVADASSPLIAYIDTGAVGLPVTPNGGNISVSWSNGANRIFAL